MQPREQAFGNLEIWTEIRKFVRATIPNEISKFPWKLEIWTVGPVNSSRQPESRSAVPRRWKGSNGPKPCGVSARPSTNATTFSIDYLLFFGRIICRQLFSVNEIDWHCWTKLFLKQEILLPMKLTEQLFTRLFWKHFPIITRQDNPTEILDQVSILI